MRLNPRGRLAAPLTLIGGAYLMKRDFDAAVANLQASIQERPGFAMSYRLLAACYAHMGRLDDAREAIDRLRAFTSLIVPRAIPLRNPEHRELFFSGLRLGGGRGDMTAARRRFRCRAAQCIAWARPMIEHSPEHIVGHMFLTAALSMQGEVTAAAEARGELFWVLPQFSLRWMTQNLPFAEEVADRLREGLRKAGIPET